jgi:hypothetical protein
MNVFNSKPIERISDFTIFDNYNRTSHQKFIEHNNQDVFNFVNKNEGEKSNVYLWH